MNCPQCGTVINEANTVTLKPAQVKNLRIHEWCFDCKKAKSYSCTLLFGKIGGDPDTVDAPDMCMCSFKQQNDASLFQAESSGMRLTEYLYL